MLELKICGLRRMEDIDYVNQFLPDYCGFILSKGYGRSISFDDFVKLKSMLNENIKAVGVFVNEDLSYIKKLMPYLDVIQLHGDEDNILINQIREVFDGQIFKAVRAKSSNAINCANELECDVMLIDSYDPNVVGGTGKTADISIINSAEISKPYFLAGGINAQNLSELLDKIDNKFPQGVDLSSSLEVDGFKDKEKIKEITQVVKSYRKKDING